MEKREVDTPIRYPTEDTTSGRFYERYWREAEDAIPTKDPTTKKRLGLLFAMLRKIGTVEKILDAGCGGGFFTHALQKAGYKAVGLDISDNALTQARQKYKNIEFVSRQLDARWPFEDSRFDVVFSTEVIEHVLGIHEMFSEMNRVLKVGGWVALTTPYHGLVKNMIIVLFGFERHFCNIEGGHIRFFTNKFLKRLLTIHGFEIRQISYIGRIPVIAKSVFVAAQKVRNNGMTI